MLFIQVPSILCPILSNLGWSGACGDLKCIMWFITSHFQHWNTTMEYDLVVLVVYYFLNVWSYCVCALNWNDFVSECCVIWELSNLVVVCWFGVRVCCLGLHTELDSSWMEMCIVPVFPNWSLSYCVYYRCAYLKCMIFNPAGECL